MALLKQDADLHLRSYTPERGLGVTNLSIHTLHRASQLERFYRFSQLPPFILFFFCSWWRETNTGTHLSLDFLFLFISFFFFSRAIVCSELRFFLFFCWDVCAGEISPTRRARSGTSPIRSPFFSPAECMQMQTADMVLLFPEPTFGSFVSGCLGTGTLDLQAVMSRGLGALASLKQKPSLSP